MDLYEILELVFTEVSALLKESFGLVKSKVWVA